MKVIRDVQSNEEPKPWVNNPSGTTVTFNLRTKESSEGDTIYIYDVINSAFSEEVTRSFWFKTLKGDLLNELLDTEIVVASLDSFDSLRTSKVILENYEALRRKEYPPIEEYLDAVVKGDIIAIEDYKSKCINIKAKFPKPTLEVEEV